MRVITLALALGGAAAGTCPGSLSGDSATASEVTLAGYTGNNAPGVSGAAMTVPIGSKSYLSTECKDGEYEPTRYDAWELLNKSLSFTVDMSAGAGCGCNFAIYLLSMAQNTNPGDDPGCGQDYYCGGSGRLIITGR